MGRLDPEFNARVTFQQAEVLPADNVLAQWVVNVSRALNDILLANRRLVAGFDDGAPPTESFYDVKQVISHSHELAKFLRASEKQPEVKALFDEIHPRARRDYEEASEALEKTNSATLDEASFGSRLISARDQASHYSEINHRLLARAMKRVQDQEGAFLAGTAFKDFRAEFAADIDAQMVFPMGDDHEPFREFTVQLQEVVEKLVTFARTAVDRYFAAHPSQLEVEPLGP